MQIRRFARWMGSLALILGATACVVHDTPPVNPGYGYYGPQSYDPAYGPPPSSAPGSDDTAGSGGVSEPTPYSVDSMPPEPLYEQMTPSPGDGFVWIDGYWHWNGYEWVWVNGRWERDQSGYVYVEPSYDYVGEQFIYVPGYWAPPARIPRHWHTRDHRHGRPTIVSRPVGGTWPPPAAGARPRPPTIGSPGRRVYAPPTVTRPGSSGLGKRQPVYRPVYGGAGVTAPVYQGPAPVAGGAQATPQPGAQPAAQPANPGGTVYYPPPRPAPVRSIPTGPGNTWRAPAQPAPAHPAPIWTNPNPAPPSGGARPPIAAPVGTPVHTPSGPGASIPPSAWRPNPPVAAPPAPAPHPAPSPHPPPAAAPPHAPPPAPAPPPSPPSGNHNARPR